MLLKDSLVYCHGCGILDQPFRFCTDIATPWRARRMRVRIATGDIGLIKFQCRIPHVFWNLLSLR
jgi:hypothetical protein